MSALVKRVIAILCAAGYQLRETLRLRNIDFEFAAVLLAPAGRSDLVVVVDATTETPAQIREKIFTLSRALDASRSRRPLTTVVVGPIERESEVESIKKVSRVLSISPEDVESISDGVSEQLAVLLPIEIPMRPEVLADSLRELAEELQNEFTPLISRLVERSNNGASAVEAELSSVLQRRLSAVLDAES
jgi:hypothetical protein